MQVTFLRGAASLPFLLAANALFGRWRDLLAKRWHLHVIRGFLSVGLLWCFVYAMGQLSLANAYTIFMSAPLLIVALSVPMLGERVGWRQWLAVLAGLIGVIIVLKPTGAGLVTIGGLAALASAIGYAVSAITIRILTRTDSAAATVFWSLLFLTIISGLIASLRWVPVQWDHWPLIVGSWPQRRIRTVLHHRGIPTRTAAGRRSARVHGARVGTVIRLAAVGHRTGPAHAGRRVRHRRQRHLRDSPRAIR